jgi:ABC-type branched-subunit amino acid transport system substrate-binding protein
VVLIALVVASCGARLTAAQVAALNATSSGNVGTASQASSNNPVSTGTNVPVATTTTQLGAGTGGSTGSAPTATSVQQAAAGGPSGSSAAVPGLSVASSVCHGPAGGAGVSASEVDVGMVTTLTGPVPGLFAGALNGIQAFASYLNSVGGICGRKMVIKSSDDNLDASQNQQATQSLAGSVLAFVGSFSGVDQGSAAVLQSDPQVPDVGEALSSQRFNLPNNFSPAPQGIAVDLAPWISYKQKYPGAITHMAALSVNQATDQAETQVAVQGLKSIGYNFVYTDYNVEVTQTDFSADAQAMKAAGAQGVLFIATSAFYAELARAMQNAGLQVTLPVYNANAYDPNLIPQAGSAANGTITYTPTALYQGEDAASNPMVALFDKWYTAVSGGSLPDLYAVWGWMSGMLFVAGLNAGGGITQANLLNGLKQVTTFDAGGLQSSANPAGKQPAGCYLIVDVVNQKFVRDPADPATGLDCANGPNWYRGS